ncbi:hypothetical protein AYI69_g155 [Smittium culicis]|uniref:Reverse transcriptase/retrotransposon-derived protein RNase H-like domain-containing protein n=1 Tax=Smittium culicis TaxID=133412 RepID=A0A1R1YTT9_9FUNG|nr:hypothetical protein AYI69_g155 [Smittium culicis]
MESIFRLLKETKIIWCEDCQLEFEADLEILKKDPVLKQPDFEYQFSSGDGSFHPVYYYSRKLTPAERNYSS